MATDWVRRKFLAMAAFGAAPGIQRMPGQALARPDVFSVTKFGAAGDGVRLDTRGIQATIDACARSGGGTVYFPPGRFVSGTIYLRSNITLYFDPGAVLLGSSELSHYPVSVPAFRSYTDNYTDKSLIYGEKLERISVKGSGVIDGQGGSFEGPYKLRPYLFRLVECRDVSIQDVTLKDSAMWGLHLLACDGADVRGISIHSRVNKNNDGIDVDCCQRVRISDCEISSGDDAIVLKSTADRPCRNITISNCVLSSACNAIKMGTESNGGFQNITISNCSIYDTRLSGIALEIVDGGILDQVIVSGITIQKVGAPIFIRLGNRARPFRQGDPQPGIGTLRRVLITGVLATGASRIGCALAGLPNHPIEGLTLDNLRLTFEGGGTREDAGREIPEYPNKYPEHSMFGVLPAYGFYCRHVKDLCLSNIALELEAPDERPALVFDNVENLRVFEARFSRLARSEQPVVLHHVSDARLANH